MWIISFALRYELRLLRVLRALVRRVELDRVVVAFCLAVCLVGIDFLDLRVGDQVRLTLLNVRRLPRIQRRLLQITLGRILTRRDLRVVLALNRLARRDWLFVCHVVPS
jgi:hypothetical protein